MCEFRNVLQSAEEFSKKRMLEFAKLLKLNLAGYDDYREESRRLLFEHIEKTFQQEKEKQLEMNATNLCVDWSSYENIVKYLNENYSSISFSIGSGDAINGYGRRELYSVSISSYAEICNNCGRSPLYKRIWKIFDGNCTSEQRRHSWNKTYITIATSASYVNFYEALKKLDADIYEMNKE